MKRPNRYVSGRTFRSVVQAISQSNTSLLSKVLIKTIYLLIYRVVAADHSNFLILLIVYLCCTILEISL